MYEHHFISEITFTDTMSALNAFDNSVVIVVLDRLLEIYSAGTNIKLKDGEAVCIQGGELAGFKAIPQETGLFKAVIIELPRWFLSEIHHCVAMRIDNVSMGSSLLKLKNEVALESLTASLRNLDIANLDENSERIKMAECCLCIIEDNDIKNTLWHFTLPGNMNLTDMITERQNEQIKWNRTNK